MMRTRLLVLGLCVALGVMGCGKGGANDGDGGSSGGPSPGDKKAEMTAPLTEADMKAYLEIWPGYMKRIGRMVQRPTVGRAVTFPQEVVGYLKSKGTTPEAFGAIVLKVNFARQAVRARKSAERATSPEAKAAVEKMLAPYKDIPEGNLELVKQYEPQIEAMYKALDKEMDE